MEEEEFGEVLMVCSFFILYEVSQRSFCHDVCKVYSKEKAGEGYKKKRIGKAFNLIRETL